MKLFKLRYNDYDLSCDYTFSHESKTKKDFENDVKSLMKKHYNEYIDQEFSWVSFLGLINFIIPKLEKFGYEKLEFEELKFSGGFIVKEDFFINDKTNFSKYINKNALEKFLTHNKILSRLMSDKNLKEEFEKFIKDKKENKKKHK